MEEQKPEIKESEVIKAKKENLEFFRAAHVEPFRYSFERTGDTALMKEKYSSIGEGQESPQAEKIAGRLVSIREHGKTVFGHIKDFKGTLQLYVKKDILGEEIFKLFRKLDIGDIIGVEGNLFKTKTGELTVKVTKFDLLTKSLLPLPEKWHGLKDKEIRYRKRYLDMVANDEVMETFKKRTAAVKAMRRYLDERDYYEVETPMMQAIPGGAKARPFKTHHNALDLELYMRIAPELYLKRLLVGGFERVYEINRNFRNEGISIKHNPEFTMLELYQAYGDFETVMKIAEEITIEAVKAVTGGNLKVTYQGAEIDFSLPWKKISMANAIKEYAGIDFNALSDADAGQKVKAKGLELRKGVTRGELLEIIFAEYVEPELAKETKPVFITEFPKEISPLSKGDRNNPALVERFELYVMGRELANGFSELNDPEDQEKRFREQIEMDTHGEVAKEVDMDYIEALKIGMPPAGGLGIGIDRLVMFITDSASIRDVILFPLLRPEGK